MKRISKIMLNDAVLISDSEMKTIFGGSGEIPGDKCWAKCIGIGGKETSIMTVCPGSCTATDYIGVSCTVDGETEHTPCPSSGTLR